MKFKIIFLTVFLISLVGHVYLFLREGQRFFPQLRERVVDKNIDFKKYSYLSPRIIQEFQNDILINFLPLREKIRSITAEYGDSFAVYFEYLPSGTSIGVNEKGETYAASLIKVPVVMAHFKEIETEKVMKKDEDRILTLMPEDIDDGFGSLWQAGAGTEISMKEAVRLALEESDNTAVLAIARSTKQKYFDEVYQGLDIDISQKDNETLITAKNYSSILKALYFSAVLSKEHSQLILEHMTKSMFNDKLPAAVPASVPVAHKIGVYQREIFSDCGIIYVPRRPYILCMFSRSSEDESRVRMKKLSREVYTFVTSEK